MVTNQTAMTARRRFAAMKRGSLVSMAGEAYHPITTKRVRSVAPAKGDHGTPILPPMSVTST
jgi:hypothetical protein